LKDINDQPPSSDDLATICYTSGTTVKNFLKLYLHLRYMY
jgi:acyl-coenzyme A synthetase/AMP-(fatty) acid ligase